MSTKRKAASRPGNMKSGHFQTEAERDSGYSDANSEHLSAMDTTDSEDSPCPAVIEDPQTPGALRTSTQTPKPGPQPPPAAAAAAAAAAAQSLAVVGGSYSRLSPMIIMNNVLLKQPVDPPPALKPWRFSPAVEVVQPVVQQPQVVFLQPVMSRQTSSSSSKDGTSSSSARHRRSKKYLPILKSYPKIAPRDGSSSSSGRGTSSNSSSASSERSIQSDHSQKLQKSHSKSIGNATPARTLTPSVVSPVLQSQLSQLPSMEAANVGLSRDSQAALPRPADVPTPSPVCFSPKTPAISTEQADLDSEGDTRRKRFCNTYNILSKSGLLDITLRTKELLRQNKRTQTDLERLKEQTDLFLEALRSGDAGVCSKLQASLREEEKEREREGRELKTDED